jgi:ribonuclease HII
VIAKVTRDRIMVGLHERWPECDFATHKGYVTPGHAAALAAHGPCREHRFSYINVRRLSALASQLDPAALAAALTRSAGPADAPDESVDGPREEIAGEPVEAAGVPSPPVRDDVYVEGVTA